MTVAGLLSAAIIIYAAIAFASGIILSWHLDEDDDLHRPWYVPLLSWPIALLAAALGTLLIEGIEQQVRK